MDNIRNKQLLAITAPATLDDTGNELLDTMASATLGDIEGENVRRENYLEDYIYFIVDRGSIHEYLGIYHPHPQPGLARFVVAVGGGTAGCAEDAEEAAKYVCAKYAEVLKRKAREKV